ncbi:unnamed protein product [Blepharisma stoltei]|uniref:Uncharacterized protein n=1 Tax=Blepharisma stoltei TaxID=1481888 RepID=A0AAU9JFN9_9CILI|nr:unnamed protein product [Blepharisma stoltei]
MKSCGVSEDLPNYLRSQYSVSNPSPPKKLFHKGVVPNIRQGVSAESPDCFHVKYVAVLSNEEKNKIISRGDRSPNRFISDLKVNKVEEKPKFQFDETKTTFDCHSLKFSKALDLMADKSPKLRKEVPYIKEYEEMTRSGFGLPRGEFTVDAMQPNVPRYKIAKLNTLKESLLHTFKRTKTSKMSSLQSKDTFITTARDCLNLSKANAKSMSPNTPRRPMKSIKQKKERPLSNQNMIEVFEKKSLKSAAPYESRQIYNLDAKELLDDN